MHLQLGHVSTILVSTPETAKQVMKTQDIVFASRFQPLAAKIISYDSANIGFLPYGDYWRQMRKICVLDLLSAKRVQSFRSLREEEFPGQKLIQNFKLMISNYANITIENKQTYNEIVKFARLFVFPFVSFKKMK